MKDLPKVFANTINKKINNEQDLFYSKDRKDIKKGNIDKKINSIFSSPNHVYKSKVLIKTSKEDIEKIIVGKNSNNLITIDGELIKINDILDIERK